jgi:protein involved in polysaccharide export with SLBB domain
MRVKDLVFQAGNITNGAYLDSATLVRLIRDQEKAETERLSFSLLGALAGTPDENILLRENDQIYIREIPQYRKALERVVHLEGEFVFPGEYSYTEGERLSAIIQRAGGLTKQAYPFGAVFQRESVKVSQRERLREYTDKLEKDILTLTAQAAETAVEPERAPVIEQTLAAKQILLEKLRSSEPTGRMVIDLRELLILPSEANDFKLEPGDRLTIGKRPDYVNVMGEVYNPTALFYEKDGDIEHYLSLVGGATKMAKESEIYVVKANGRVISRRQGGFFNLGTWDSKQDRWTLSRFDRVKLDPGDTIIVPRKVTEYPWLRIAKDVTQIIYQIAVAAGVIYNVAF